MTTLEALRENGKQVSIMHGNLNTFQLAGKMRKNGCDDETINEAFIALLKNPNLNPWKFAGYIKREKDIDNRVEEHQKLQKENMISLGDVLSLMLDKG